MFDYETIEPGYYDKVFTSSGPQGQWHRDKFQTVVNRCLSRDFDSILDVGCSSGTFLRVLENKYKGCRLVGLDYSKKQIEKARHDSSSNINFIASDASDFFMECDEKFQLITMIEIIEHFDRAYIEKILRCAFECLEIGGRLIITTPNYQSAWPFLELLVNRFSPLSYGEQHVTKFCPGELKKFTFKALGEKSIAIDIIRFQGFAPFLWFFPDWVRRLIVSFETKNIFYGNLLLMEVVREK